MTTCKRLLFFIFLFSFLDSSAQESRLDNLKKNIDLARTSSDRLKATLEFCDEWESFSPDTLYKYVLLAKELAGNEKDSNGILLSDYYMAAYLFQKNKVDTALTAIDDVIARAKKTIPYNETSLKFWMLRGNILQRTAHYDEVLKQDFSLITLAEKHHDTIGLIRFNTGIGNVNLRLKKTEEALKWHYKATDLMQTEELKIKCSFVYINIAVVYYHLAVLNDSKQNEDSIEINLQRAIQYSRKGHNLTNLANGLSMYGNVLAEYKKLYQAEAVLKEALDVRKKIGDVFYEIADMTGLSSFYENSGNYAKALDICLQALDLAKANGRDFSSMSGLYSVLGEIYSNHGDYEKYSEVLKERLKLRTRYIKLIPQKPLLKWRQNMKYKKSKILLYNNNTLLLKRITCCTGLYRFFLWEAFFLLFFSGKTKRSSN